MRLNNVFLLFAAAGFLVSCTKFESDNEPGSPECGEVTLLIEDTRTSVDNVWQTSWSSSDKISIFGSRQSGSSNTTGYSSFSYQGDGRFSGNAIGKFDSPYNWFAFYPDASYSSKMSSLTLTVEHPVTQVQRGQSNSHICGANDPLYGYALNVKEKPVIRMHHIASVIDFRIQNSTQKPIRVLKVRFTAPKPLAGTFKSDPIDIHSKKYSGGEPVWSAGSSGSCTVVLDVEGGAVMDAEGKDDFYASIHPIHASGEYTVEVIALSDGNLVYSSRTLDIEMNFTAGKYKVVNFNFSNPRDTSFTNIENPRLKAYLDQLEATPYFTSDDFVPWDGNYTVTLMTKALYGDNGASNRLDQPAPVELFWEGPASMVRVFSDESMSDCVMQVSVPEGQHACIYNLIPGKEYRYAALNGKDTVARGTFAPSGRRRMMKTSSTFGKDHAANCRDFGGLPTVDGKHLRYDLIYRGSNIDKLREDSEMQETLLHVMGIKLDVDIRDAGQKLNHVQDYSEYGIIRTPQDYGYIDETDLQDPVKVSATLDSVMNHVLLDEPVYIHCQIGSDRTGYICMLIESLLGVRQIWTDSDYEITSFASSQTSGPRLRIEKNPEGGSYSGGHFKEGLRFLSTFQGATLSDKVYDYVVTSRDGLKMDKSKVDAFRLKMTE